MSQDTVEKTTSAKVGMEGKPKSVRFWAAVIAVIIRSFLLQPFNIPSSSMKPTLLIGDFLFV